MERCLIVAVDEHFGIGVKGDLPWHISEDLKYFKQTTLGFPVIMGRTTWESLPFKPLKGRKNIVLSRSLRDIPGAVCVGSLEEAFKEAEPSERCFIIGGASVYGAAMKYVDTMYVTHVHTEIRDADAFFPEVDLSVWDRVSVSGKKTDGESGLEYEFAVYRRKV